MARQVLENGVILPAEYSDDWYDDMTSNLTKLDDVIGSDSEKLSSADVGAAALSNNYNDLDNLPTIPTVNDATLTIQKNGVDVQTFTANASSNVTANITVPTKTSDLTNDSNFVDTSNSAVASGITSAKVTDYDTHIADTDIHVTTADKTKWNDGVSQSYVLRYSSASVTDNSTIAYSTLDNTDNIKASDKVIDVDGKIFSVVSVDTANQTVTVGTALIDLALDVNVVHTSGNETVGGQKTFSKYITSNGSTTGDEYSNNARTNLWLMSNRDTEEVSGVLFDTFRQNTAQGTGLHILGFGIKENSIRYEGCRFSWLWDNNLSGYTFDFKPTTQGTNQAVKHNLGTSTDKWDTINGLSPSSLGMPDLSNGIDISSYITHLDKVVNQYTPPVNGYINIRVKKTSLPIVSIRIQQNYGLMNSSETADFSTWGTCLPVVAGQVVEFYISADSLMSAIFFPCQGNV